MRAYRVAYTDEAAASRLALAPEHRKPFEDGMRAIAARPYDCGSTAVRGDRDRREAAVGGVALVRYEVSAAVLIVTVLRLVPAP
ncbi:hypothetical protein [Streptomyces mayteni]